MSSLILLLKTFKISLQGNIWNDNFNKDQSLPDKIVAMVTADNLGNQKYFFQLHRLILKATMF